MLRNILIGTALTLVAASTSLTPAIAKSIPLNYIDPCKTALENFEQADWERTHRTGQGNLGGADGWDELADAADQNAQTQRDRAAEHAKTAKTSSDPDFWNKQAADAAREAGEWADRAEEHRAQARKMRREALDYEVAARKALEECREQLNAKRAAYLERLNARTAEILLQIDDILKPIGKGNGQAETTETEKKVNKKKVQKAESGGKIKNPKRDRVRKTESATQTAAQSMARDVVVSVATGFILGEIGGISNGHKNKKHHKLDRHQQMEGHTMGEGKSRRKMKKNKMMSIF